MAIVIHLVQYCCIAPREFAGRSWRRRSRMEPLESTVAHVAGVLAEMAERYAATTVRFCEGGEV